jgi:exopolyphosphatase/guanosine-5'-triphosphate,3'-diphosphate pyrophosphatase
MSQPMMLAAVDVGSNAIRMTIARAASAGELFPVESQRCAVRLGHQAFTRHEIDRDSLDRAVVALRIFRDLFDRHGVQRYRAVATSATREARNGNELADRARREAGIELEIVSGSEEARLVRAGVLGSLPRAEHLSPRLILDLGGGSLEINLFNRSRFLRSATLPLGAVRLMELFGARGAVDEETFEEIRGHVSCALRGALSPELNLGGALAVACGGNAEALARISPGEPLWGLETLDCYLLCERLWSILRLDVDERIKVFKVRRDRAEVMGVAAIVLATLWRWLNLGRVLVPGVGIRDGILAGLSGAIFGTGSGGHRPTKGDNGHAYLPRKARNRG